MVTGKTIYPHRPDLWGKFFYQCVPCEAYCGCHPNSDRPLGKLATARLRKLRSACHLKFDQLWKSGEMTRKEAYSWLQDKMNMSQEDAHIGMFNEIECEKLLKVWGD